jgi:uncharacterized protein (TIRG00374 family)
VITRQHVAFALQCVISIALLALLFRSLDLAALRRLFATLPIWFYLLSLSVVVAGQLLYAWRWWLLLGATGLTVPFGTVVRQYFIGIFLNNFFPSTVGGDMAKVYYLGREHGYRPIAASIVLDRLLSIGFLALLATTMYWIAPDPSPRFAGARTVVTLCAIGLAALILLLARGTGGLPARLSRFGTRAVSLGLRLQRFRLDMAVAVRNPRIVAQSAGVVTTYFTVLTSVYVVFAVINVGAHPPFLTLMTAVTTASLLSNLPVSVNGLGIREQLHALLLQPLGIPREAAVAISLLLFAHLLVSSLFGLLFWLRLPALPDNVASETGV